MTKIQSFKDLEVWKEGHKLVLMIYEATKKFPKDEAYGLTSQMRRAIVSTTSNLSEGFGRATYRDKQHFYQIGLGSNIELQNQILIAKDVQYINEDIYLKLNVQAVKVEHICRGLIRKSQSFY